MSVYDPCGSMMEPIRDCTRTQSYYLLKGILFGLVYCLFVRVCGKSEVLQFASTTSVVRDLEPSLPSCRRFEEANTTYT